MRRRRLCVAERVVDLFLGDIHFGNDDCARELGRIPEYLPSITNSFRAAVDSGASVIIRHLVMPGTWNAARDRHAVGGGKLCSAAVPSHVSIRAGLPRGRRPGFGAATLKTEIAAAKQSAQDSASTFIRRVH
jgi:hypothetical protein